MKKFLPLSLLMPLLTLLLPLLTACGQTDELTAQPPLTREVEGVLQQWRGEVLLLRDDQGRQLSFYTGQALVSGSFVQETGCAVRVLVSQDGPPDLALRVCLLHRAPEAILAQSLLNEMSLEQKVGQMFLARCPEQNGAELAASYHLGGYVLFARDFRGFTAEQAKERIQSYQQAADLPLYMAVDEEGGDVVRLSCYPAYRASAFPSPQHLYRSGGITALRQNEEEKAALLRSLGINLNLAPVADVSTSEADFIYRRSLGEDAETTAAAVAVMVEALQQGGVSAALKHFPGYGNNADTHTGVARDTRPAQTFYECDLLPFGSGIEAGARFVLVSHNIVTAFDAELPASLSPALHELLRQELGFSGIILTDDLAMGGVVQLYGVRETAVLAVLAGNDMLLSSDPASQIEAVLQAVAAGRIREEMIDRAVLRILRAKISSGLIPPAA